MTLEAALRLTEVLLCVAVVQRGVEHWRQERWLSVGQIAAAIVLLAGLALPGLMALWLLGLAQLRRFRGPYNGGADKMVLLAISCALMARLWPQASEPALAYLAIQLLLSYWVSGWVKLRNPDWRSGRALSEVFAVSIYPASEGLRGWAARSGRLRLASVGVIGFELAMPLSLVSPITLATALTCAAAFHLSNAVFFGLNRFFWAWIAAYPSLIWFQGRIGPF